LCGAGDDLNVSVSLSPFIKFCRVFISLKTYQCLRQGGVMLSRTLSIKAFIVLFMTLTLFISCGGGGGSSEAPNSPDNEIGAIKESFTIDSQSHYGLTYNISVGIPPIYDETGPPQPAIFLLDGNYYFDDLYDSYDEDDDFLLIGINNSDRRHIDYLPANTCEEENGGASTFFNFLVSELIPYLDEHYNIDPELRVLFGHSYGGCFVFYTLFRDHGDTFPVLFSNDASLSCWDVSSMENNYFYSNKSLPVIFYCSAAAIDDVKTGDDANAYANTPIINTIKQRNYTDLNLKYEIFMGTHNGILNDAFSSGFDWISDQVDGPSD
jgi:predicted alpha/beta superfamily hydrolase